MKENVWDRIANIYGQKKYFGKSLFKEEKKVLNKLIKKDIRLILDAGCGTGRHLRFLSSKGFFVVGLDYSKNMILNAKKLMNGSYVIGDIRNLPFKDSVFDATICLGNTIGSIQDVESVLEKIIKEMKRVTKNILIIEFRSGGKKEIKSIGNEEYEVKTWKMKEVRNTFSSLDLKFKIIKGKRLSNCYFFYVICNLKNKNNLNN
jgi:SAM-dependent methyltransferase